MPILKHKILSNNKGFTLVEIMVAGIMILFLASSIWAVYWSIVNAYTVERRGSDLQYEGDLILNLISNGGYYNSDEIYQLKTNTAISGPVRIYGLNSSVPKTNFPNVGETAALKTEFSVEDSFRDPTPGGSCTTTYRYDYRIEFCLDSDGVTDPRYAEFAVQLYDCDDGGGGVVNYSKAILWYRFLVDDGVDDSKDFAIKISENIVTRTINSTYDDYEYTWFKAQLLPKESSSDYYSGIRVSFYLADLDQQIQFNKDLDRELITPIEDDTQRKSYLGGVPYPKYFSRTIYFPVRIE